jgi:cellulose synthase operon protein B
MVLISPTVLLANAAQATDYPAPLPVSVTPPSGTPVGGVRVLGQSFKQLGFPQGLTIKTVHGTQTLAFSRPRGWQVLPSSALVVRFDHSRALTPGRSSLNVGLNGRIIQSVALTAGNIANGQVVVPLTPDMLQDQNTLTFQVDQHYTYKCEDPYNPTLWTTIRPDSVLKLDFKPKVPPAQLANFPYPFVDDLAQGPNPIGFVGSATTLSGESQTAVATVAASLGNLMAWHPGQVQWLNASKAFATDSNLVVIGTPQENPAIGQLLAFLPVKPNGKGFTGPVGLGGDDGVIQLVPHPKFPGRSVLVVSGNSVAGVKKAAQLLAAVPTSRLMSGPYTIVQTYQPPNHNTTRAWEGFITQPGQTVLAHLGLNTHTIRGFEGPPVKYSLKRMPDLYLGENEKVTLTTRYSYASQLDTKQSNLEVKLNGKSVGSVKLDKPEGATNAAFTIEIPAPDFYTFNDLEYQFHIYPEKTEKCRFITDAHLWGTLHNSSTIALPATVQAALPDVGYLNDAGFPFTLAPDLSQLTVVLPDAPTPAEADTFLQLMVRLGRITPGHASKRPTVLSLGQWRSGAAQDDHIVVIGRKPLETLSPQFKSKYQLVIDGKTDRLTETEKPLARIAHVPDQGVVEEILSPLNHDRVALLLYGETEAGQQQVADILKSDEGFGAMEPGNLVVINQGKPTSVIALKKGEAKNLTAAGEQSNGNPFGGWVQWLIAGLVGFGLFKWISGLFNRPKRLG